MTDSEVSLLRSSVDRPIVLETKEGTFLAHVLFVFDEGETPDMFYLEMELQPDGQLVQRGASGHSVLLKEIVSVSPFTG